MDNALGTFITRIMALHRYHATNIGAGPYVMQSGGGLRRYHTPVVNQGGGGMARDLLNVARPDLLAALGDTLDDVAQRKPIRSSLKRNLKRRAPSIAWKAGKYVATQQYKKAKRAARDIFDKLP